LEELLNRADAELGGGVRAGGSAGANPPAGNIKRFKSGSTARYFSFLCSYQLTGEQFCVRSVVVGFSSFTAETKTNKH
jgi:hypothetical protein